MHYVRIACQVLELLVGTEIGFEYLKDNKFIASIAEMLRTENEASLQESDQKVLFLIIFIISFLIYSYTLFYRDQREILTGF